MPEAELPLRCPCCFCKTLSRRAFYEICPVCSWEDDGQDDQDANDVSCGPNGGVSLAEGRLNYQRIGACDPRCIGSVRPPTPEERP